MLVDDLKSRLKTIEPDIDTLKTFWQRSGNEETYQRLHALSSTEDFWQNPDQTKILKELQAVKNQRDAYNNTVQSHTDLPELLELFADDEDELKKLALSIDQLASSVRQLKVTFLLSDEHDKLNCFFTINAGAGGTESQDWANMLLRMYLRFCERERLTTQVVDHQPGDEAGIKSATLFIKGKRAYGLMKNEHGIHRLVRISPFDASKRRHTSFAGVFVIPEAAHTNIVIDPQELRIDTYRSSGAGGQHVNTTDSAVRITHLPSGTVVQCQNERSQLQNKETAMKMLKAKLIQKQEEAEKSKRDTMEKKKIEWGSQIRSYVLHPYKMVKDHRTNHESPQPDHVLDGDLMPFIEQNLIRISNQ